MREIKSDIEIAQECNLKPIGEISDSLGIKDDYVEPCGKYKAKINYTYLKDNPGQQGKLVLVTAMTPTPSGEGKTTMTIGLTDALRKLGKRAVAALREPSLGPVFGLKGGAAGGGYSQVVPMEDINLHFTGDFYAISAANNLIAAMLDNHIHQGNKLNIDPGNITWNRCIDMNDRQLRYIVAGLGSKSDGFTRQDSYDITAASEVMALFCLANDIDDLKKRLARAIVAYDYNGKPVTADDIHAAGAAAALLKDALKPNMVQTLEGSPVFVHGGPFANIAHGCNSLIATRMALNLGDYAVTEAGFGADLGAEKFLDIKCRMANLKPDAVVIVASVRSLKMHGGVPKDKLSCENTDALKRGIPNLLRHINNIKNVYGLRPVVCVNVFVKDSEAELSLVEESCKDIGVNVAFSRSWEMGGEGSIDLAKEVIRLCDAPNNFRFAYELEGTIEEKIEKIVRKVYGGLGINVSEKAKKQISMLTALGFDKIPICIAKTQYSFSDNKDLLGAPEGFVVTVKNVKVSAGAGFLVVLTGDIMTMPGLPKFPAAEKIDVNSEGVISGLF